jgi:hypothetical protein
MAKITADGEAAWNTTASTQDANLRFFTAADGSLSERLRITSAGLLGIGTSAPNYQLHVTTDFAVGASGFNQQLTFSNDTIQSLLLGTGYTALKLNPLGGNVGIGTSSPNALLDVRSATAWVGDGTTDAFLQFNQSATAANRWHIGAGSDNAFIFYKGTYGTGVETARIDSSGRLLVGTSSTSGAEKVIIATTGTFGVAYQPALRLQNSSSGGSTSNPTGLGAINWNIEDLYDVANIEAVRTNPAGGTLSDLIFRTNGTNASTGAGTERMRIHSSGYITYGTGSIDATGLTFGPTRSGTNSAPTLTWNGSFTGTVTACDFLYNGARQGSITTTISATAYNTSSDYRLKENVIPVSDGIVRLQQLKPSRFNFIADSDQTVDGFIAHEVQAVVPECVTGEKDAVDDDGNPIYQGIDQSKLVPLLTAALQEAVARIEQLEAAVTALQQ